MMFGPAHHDPPSWEFEVRGWGRGGPPLLELAQVNIRVYGHIQLRHGEYLFWVCWFCVLYVC